MESFKKILGWMLKALGGLALLLILFVASIYFFSRQERALAREFILLAGERKYEAAFDLTSDEMRKVYPLHLLKTQFDRIRTYSDVSFHSVNLGSGQTTLSGSATTDDNCSSPIVFVFEDNKIATFQIDVPCLVRDKST